MMQLAIWLHVTSLSSPPTSAAAGPSFKTYPTITDAEGEPEKFSFSVAMSAAVEMKNGPKTAQKHGLKDATAAEFGKGTLT
jgi:hypothetical protein